MIPPTPSVSSSFTPFQNILSLPQERTIPPIGPSDSMIGSVSVHGSTTFLADSEILEKLPLIKREELAPSTSIWVSYTMHRAAIIQQQATRGCTAAVAAMLIQDHGKQPNIDELIERNLGNDDDQERDLREAGLTPITHTAANLNELQKLLHQYGPAIVSVRDRYLGNHVILVDDVSADLSRIRIRDPYHGWEITISNESFLRIWVKTESIMQATE